MGAFFLIGAAWCALRPRPAHWFVLGWVGIMALPTVLAEDARRGNRRLGYYHHGAPAEDLEELARRGAWIHVSAAGAGADLPALLLLRDIAAKAAAAGAGLVIHLERLIPEPGLEDLHKAGAFLLFHVPPSDYRSPYRALRAKASRRVLDPRAYYLYSEFMR